MDTGPLHPRDDTPAAPRRRAGHARRRTDSEDAVGIVLRAIALAAVALSIGVAASLLLESRPAGYLAVPAAKP